MEAAIKTSSPWRSRRWMVPGIFLLYTVLQLYCIPRLSINYDEGLFAYYGATLLKGKADKDIALFDSKLPITALNMLPRAVEQVLHPGLKKPNDQSDIIHGRYISLLVTLVLGWLVYLWTDKLYGARASLFSLAIFLLCPNFLAHGVFVSSDIFACLFTTASFFFLWRYQQTGRYGQFLLAAFSVGLAEVSKFSMVHLWIVFPPLLLNACFRRKNSSQTSRVILFRYAGLMAIFFFISWFTISAAHQFFDLFKPLGAYTFRSDSCRALQVLLGSRFPVPFPSSYMSSLDAVMYFDHLGGGHPGSLNGPSYLLGKSSPSGFWYYYFVVLLFKLPIPVLLLIVLSLIVFVARDRLSGFGGNEIYLLLPACYFLVYMNLFYSTQLGVRHIMIILPLLYIFTGRLTRSELPRLRWLAAGTLAWQCISVLLWFPHFLPYTNELLPDKKLVYRKIADTNICYGEGRNYLEQYLQEHPTAIVHPANPVAGQVIIEINELINQNIRTMHRYDWANQLMPVDHIHSQYLIFEVSQQKADSLLTIYRAPK